MQTSVETLTVYAGTVRIGDVVNVNGRDRLVKNMFTVRGNRKWLIFSDGGKYALAPGDSLCARRVQDTKVG